MSDTEVRKAIEKVRPILDQVIYSFTTAAVQQEDSEDITWLLDQRLKFKGLESIDRHIEDMVEALIRRAKKGDGVSAKWLVKSCLYSDETGAPLVALPKKNIAKRIYTAIKGG